VEKDKWKSKEGKRKKRGREKREKDWAKMIRGAEEWRQKKRRNKRKGVQGEIEGEERRQNDARKREGYPSMDVYCTKSVDLLV
jgi:hypothetical protein